ncbi:MAG: zinc ribbon domain-containing protein [Clostridia bacterium]|nr:zinc ribbon domain-containing protein [Clostridia bacterium]
MSEKICANCREENQSHFTFCRYCGATLPVVDKIRHDIPKSEEKRLFDELSYFEYRRFIGAGADNILYDFEKLEDRRFVFSLPVLFLGILFGFYGMSAWFFYRKLKKSGLILLLVAAFFTLLEGVLNFSVNKTLVIEIFRILGSNFDSTQMAMSLSDALNYYSYSFIGFSNYISFVASFFVSAFALRIYKNVSYNRALAIKSSFSDESVLPLDIMLHRGGGTSPLLALVPIVLSLLAPILSVGVGLL